MSKISWFYFNYALTNKQNFLTHNSQKSLRKYLDKCNSQILELSIYFNHQFDHMLIS